MKRRLLYLVLVLLLASLVLSGCQTAPAGSTNQTIRIGTDAAWAPFEFIDESTRDIVGFDIDLMKAIAAKEGLTVEFVNVGFDPLLAGMATCQYDAAISAMTITEDRKASMLFSDPYFGAGQLVVVRTDNTDITGKDSLVGKVAGAQIGTTGALELADMGDVTLRTYDEVSLAFQDLMNGQIDAVVADDALARGYISKNATRIKSAGEPFTNEEYGIAVCKDKPEILAKINSGLAAVRADGTYDRLIEQWFLAE